MTPADLFLSLIPTLLILAFRTLCTSVPAPVPTYLKWPPGARKVGRDARAVEVAERLGLGIDEYHRLLGDIDSAHVEALDIGCIGGDPDGKRTAPIRAAYVASQGPPPEEALEDAESEEALSQAIKSLPERERFIIEATYFEGLYLHEVGALLGLTESRICQLRTQAEARLRARLACAA